MPVQFLAWVDLGSPLFDTRGCYYFVATWEVEQWPIPGDEIWPVKDVPGDPNAIVFAHWMPCEEAFTDWRLSGECRSLLDQALRCEKRSRGGDPASPCPRDGRGGPAVGLGDSAGYEGVFVMNARVGKTG